MVVGAVAGSGGATLLLLLLVFARGYPRRRNGKASQACSPCHSTAVSVPSQARAVQARV